jgi:hypothetical protein
MSSTGVKFATHIMQGSLYLLAYCLRRFTRKHIF